MDDIYSSSPQSDISLTSNESNTSLYGSKKKKKKKKKKHNYQNFIYLYFATLRPSTTLRMTYKIKVTEKA